MKISIVRESLLKAIQPLMPVAGRSTAAVGSGQVLGHLKISATEGLVGVLASDTETEVRSSTNAEVIEQGVVLAPARKLYDLVRGLKDGAVLDLRSDGNCLSLSTPGSRYKLNCLQSDQFPSMTGNVGEEGKAGILDIADVDLKRLLAGVIHAMGKGHAVATLNGLLFHVAKGELKCVATDGHRLAAAKLVGVESTDCRIIIPAKAVSDIYAMLHGVQDKVRFTWSKSFVRIDVSGLAYQTRLVAGTFPDYEKVIPLHTQEVTTDRQGLRAAVERARILSNPTHNTIALLLDRDQVGVQAGNSDQESSVENIDANVDLDKMDIGFKADYVLDALDAFKESDKIRIAMKDAGSSAMIRAAKDNNVIQVVMPVRL